MFYENEKCKNSNFKKWERNSHWKIISVHFVTWLWFSIMIWRLVGEWRCLTHSWIYQQVRWVLNFMVQPSYSHIWGPGAHRIGGPYVRCGERKYVTAENGTPIGCWPVGCVQLCSSCPSDWVEPFMGQFPQTCTLPHSVFSVIKKFMFHTVKHIFWSSLLTSLSGAKPSYVEFRCYSFIEKRIYVTWINGPLCPWRRRRCYGTSKSRKLCT